MLIKEYEKLQEEWLAVTNLKPEDLVIVICGWEVGDAPTDPPPQQDLLKCIGKVGNITYIDPDSIQVDTGRESWWYPFWCLSKWEE